MSIKPYWVAKILNGEKTIEIRKKFPSNYRGWVYIYCTKNGYLHLENNGKWSYSSNQKYTYVRTGKVVARFCCDEIEYIEAGDFKKFNYTSYGFDSFRNTISAFSCLSIEQIDAYLKGKDGYAIHISKLEIFDKPIELSAFDIKISENRYRRRKAPQSWQYIEI